MANFKKTGVTDETPQNLVIGAGMVIKGAYPSSGEIQKSQLLGMTKGGGSLTITPNYVDIQGDGLKPNTKGFDLIDYFECKFTTTLSEVSQTTIKACLPTIDFDTTGKGKLRNNYKMEDYQDITWIGERPMFLGETKIIAITLNNALNRDAFTLTIADKAPNTLSFSATASYDINNYNEVPISFIVPTSLVEG